MDFALTDDQKAVAELASKIFKDRLTPEQRKAVEQRDDRVDDGLWRELATAGLLGVAIAEEHGGAGHGLLEQLALLVAAGAAAAPVPLWAALSLGAAPIARFGTAEQKGRWLPEIIAGRAIVTAGLVEQDAADLLAPIATAQRSGSGWTLRGEKSCVPAALHPLTARIMVAAKLADGGGVGLFLVDPRGQGVAIERQVATTGEIQGLVKLDGAVVGDGERLGGGDLDGVAALAWTIDRALVGLCAMELGITEHVLRMTASYTAQRQQFDRPIATFQAVAQRAADAYIDVESIRLTTWEAAWRLEQGLPAARQIAIAKIFAADAGQRVTYAAQHLHGGIGFDLEYPLARYYTLSKQIELTLGGASQHIARLGAALAAAAD
jgi:3-oxocholest-4-en-26-oyl-CoA dehydrogenase beta subunit